MCMVHASLDACRPVTAVGNKAQARVTLVPVRQSSELRSLPFRGLLSQQVLTDVQDAYEGASFHFFSVEYEHHLPTVMQGLGS